MMAGESIYCTGFDLNQAELMFSPTVFCVWIADVQTISYIGNVRMKYSFWKLMIDGRCAFLKSSFLWSKCCWLCNVPLMIKQLCASLAVKISVLQNSSGLLSHMYNSVKRCCLHRDVFFFLLVCFFLLVWKAIYQNYLSSKITFSISKENLMPKTN